MNWGNGLAIALALFAGGLAFAVYKASQQNFDLVSKDYYAKELAYQETIDRKENALSLGKTLLRLENDNVVIDFPEALEGQKASASIHMYYVTDARRDFVMTKKNWTVKDLTLPYAKLGSGRWTAKITIDGNKGYYFDPEITLP